MKRWIITIGILAHVTGCGVRGDPVAPKTPPNLGRGQPTYRGATEDLKFQSVPPVYAPQIKEDKDEEKK